MRSLLAVLLLVAASLTALADPAPPVARAEIDALLTKLQSSACEFNRNGSWYNADQAKSHLQMKLRYLEDRNLVQTAEQFIERAATGSSMSGKPYLVRCSPSAPVESSVWLTTELKAVRAAGKPAAAR
jgi:hypothetical protein